MLVALAVVAFQCTAFGQITEAKHLRPHSLTNMTRMLLKSGCCSPENQLDCGIFARGKHHRPLPLLASFPEMQRHNFGDIMKIRCTSFDTMIKLMERSGRGSFRPLHTSQASTHERVRIPSNDRQAITESGRSLYLRKEGRSRSGV